MVSIPAALARQLGITPGCKLEWEADAENEEIRVRVIPKRGDLARRLMGAGRKFSPGRDAVAELVEERRADLAEEFANDD
jgi:bifunctional DNA-binding transcriptional regulator/antitoxin component of YhaV-PrlF toxin-antitoxin module